jgi:hypothetical protein
MTTATGSDEFRLGRLEGQVGTLAQGIQDIREELRATNSRLDAGLQELREGQRDLNARIDWLFLASWAVGGGIIAALVVQIIRAG